MKQIYSLSVIPVSNTISELLRLTHCKLLTNVTCGSNNEPGFILGFGNIVESMIDTCLHGTYILMGKINYKQVK